MNTFIWTQSPDGGVFCSNSQTFPWLDINLHVTSKVTATLLSTLFLPVFPVLPLVPTSVALCSPMNLKIKIGVGALQKNCSSSDKELESRQSWGLPWTLTGIISVHSSFTRTDGTAADDLTARSCKIRTDRPLIYTYRNWKKKKLNIGDT